MGLFDKIKNPIFLKEDSEAEKQLEILKELKTHLSGDALEKIEQEINCVESGIIGEKQVHFELENSHIPMFVLHDLFLEDEGLTAQIDYLIITRKNVYIIECKNLYGNIEINNSGSFIRSYQYKGKIYKEGIYSPITQNERHFQLIKSIRYKTKNNILIKAMFDKHFGENYHTVVVLANPKTVLNDKFAKKEIKKMVIRADQLVSYIKETDSQKKEDLYSEKEMEEAANFFLGQNRSNPTDYTEKYKKLIEEQADDTKQTENSESDLPLCPMCGSPMVLRTAKKGDNIGGQFYGCSKFPKCRGIRQV